MYRCEELRLIVEDLIRVAQRQARELDRLVERVEQLAGHLGGQPGFGVIAGELAELLVRTRQLAHATHQIDI